MKEKKIISARVFENILIATIIMIYFIIINFAYYKLNEATLLMGLKILSMIFLGMCIIFLEIAYKKDNGKIAINAVEILVLAGFTLSISHVIETNNFNFANYILISSYVFSIYYVFKAILVFTKERKEYLKSLSDIKDIVANEPIKKEAEKRHK